MSEEIKAPTFPESPKCVRGDSYDDLSGIFQCPRCKNEANKYSWKRAAAEQHHFACPECGYCPKYEFIKYTDEKEKYETELQRRRKIETLSAFHQRCELFRAAYNSAGGNGVYGGDVAFEYNELAMSDEDVEYQIVLEMIEKHGEKFCGFLNRWPAYSSAIMSNEQIPVTTDTDIVALGITAENRSGILPRR